MKVSFSIVLFPFLFLLGCDQQLTAEQETKKQQLI